MSAAVKFLESVAEDFGDPESIEIFENVSMSDAIYATKIAQLQLLLELEEYIKEPFGLVAIIDGKIRQLKREKVKI